TESHTNETLTFSSDTSKDWVTLLTVPANKLANLGDTLRATWIWDIGATVGSLPPDSVNWMPQVRCNGSGALGSTSLGGLVGNQQVSYGQVDPNTTRTQCMLIATLTLIEK